MKSTVEDAELISLSKYTDDRGTLVPIESGKDIDLVFKRSFFVFDVPRGQTRGYHAHRSSEQLLMCPMGRCTVILRDGKRSREIVLDSPEKAVYVPAMIWNEILYEKNECFFLALTTETYSNQEYVSEWEEFMKLKGIK